MLQSLDCIWNRLSPKCHAQWDYDHNISKYPTSTREELVGDMLDHPKATTTSHSHVSQCSLHHKDKETLNVQHCSML